MIHAWFTRLARWPGALADRLGRRGPLVALVALTALALPLAVWGWNWVGAALAPSPVSHASPLPPPAPPPRPPRQTPTFFADLERGPAPAAASRALPEPGAAARMPDPFEGAADDTVSLKLLERKLRIKEAELKLAQLERQIRELRDGAGPASAARPSGLAGLPSAPPALRALPPLPPLGDLPSPAPRQAAAPAATPAPAPSPAPTPPSPPAPAPPAPVWPVVRLVALGAEPFALVEIGGDVAQVSRGDQLGDVIVERVDLNGVGFRHLPTDQRRFALVSGEPSAKPGKTP